MLLVKWHGVALVMMTERFHEGTQKLTCAKAVAAAFRKDGVVPVWRAFSDDDAPQAAMSTPVDSPVERLHSDRDLLPREYTEDTEGRCAHIC